MMTKCCQFIVKVEKTWKCYLQSWKLEFFLKDEFTYILKILATFHINI